MKKKHEDYFLDGYEEQEQGEEEEEEEAQRLCVSAFP